MTREEAVKCIRRWASAFSAEFLLSMERPEHDMEVAETILALAPDLLNEQEKKVLGGSAG
jgi:hypothetical protein